MHVRKILFSCASEDSTRCIKCVKQLISQTLFPQSALRLCRTFCVLMKRHLLIILIDFGVLSIVSFCTKCNF